MLQPEAIKLTFIQLVKYPVEDAKYITDDDIKGLNNNRLNEQWGKTVETT